MKLFCHSVHGKIHFRFHERNIDFKTSPLFEIEGNISYLIFLANNFCLKRVRKCIYEKLGEYAVSSALVSGMSDYTFTAFPYSLLLPPSSSIGQPYLVTFHHNF